MAFLVKYLTIFGAVIIVAVMRRTHGEKTVLMSNSVEEKSEAFDKLSKQINIWLNRDPDTWEGGWKEISEALSEFGHWHDEFGAKSLSGLVQSPFMFPEYTFFGRKKEKVLSVIERHLLSSAVMFFLADMHRILRLEMEVYASRKLMQEKYETRVYETESLN